ncbi:MAG: methionine--tRNA ligase [Candidatus Bipolaricaulota bacterium]|nr:methionine--tRNA ligase [Candidatus Bipolaricaulota bacterium]
MDKKRVLVCSAWPYASGVPHLGNLVSSLLSGDVFTRYYRLRGHDVLYVSGSDAHGTRIEYEAKQLGITPAELADRNHKKICAVIDGFGIEFDNYTTTESPVHKEFIQRIYLDMEKNGYITTKEEDRAYCRNCKVFLADRFISGTCPRCGSPGALGNQCDNCGAILEPEELIDPVCSFCGKGDIEFRSTRHWYLDLARLSSQLQKYVASRNFQGNVHQFTQQMITDGLRPRAMTRDIDWGITAPFDGAEGKVIYVWGEAALGYVSAAMEHFAGGDGWKEFWYGDNVHQIYAIGKDNIPFHTLIFPGQLIASGRGYHLPDQIAATEYLNWIGGDSFSKSRGVGLYCDGALKVMDAELWRFYLIYNRPEGRDVNFSWEELAKAVNGVFISNVANLTNRVLSFIQDHNEHIVPDTDIDSEVTDRLGKTLASYERAMEGASLSRALREACLLAVFGNEYFQRKEPWASNDDQAVASAFHLVKAIAILLSPFVPRYAARVLEIMGVGEARWEEIDSVAKGSTIGSSRVLVERIDVGKIEREVEELHQERVSFDDFSRLDMQVGRVLSASPVPGADRLYQLQIDVGTRTLTIVAGIRKHYSSEDLIGQQVVVLVNLEPTVIRGVKSEGMLLVAGRGKGISLLAPDHDVPPGSPIG